MDNSLVASKAKEGGYVRITNYKGHGRIRGIFGPVLKNLHFGTCVRDDLKTKRNGRKNCSDFYFGCLFTSIINKDCIKD
jgi:hypothetical protein